MQLCNSDDLGPSQLTMSAIITLIIVLTAPKLMCRLIHFPPLSVKLFFIKYNHVLPGCHLFGDNGYPRNLITTGKIFVFIYVKLLMERLFANGHGLLVVNIIARCSS